MLLRYSIQNIKKKILQSRILKLKVQLPVVLILLVLVFFLGLNYKGQGLAGRGVIRTSINRAEQIKEIKINVNKAEITDTIKISQKQSFAPGGKKFLVVFTDVENASSSAQLISFGNLFRLEEDSKKLAPLPINSSFTVPAKATLEKQLVFVVAEAKKEFKLLIGELDKEQTSLELKF